MNGKFPTEIKMSTNLFEQLVDELFSYVKIHDRSKNVMAKEQYKQAKDPTIFGMKIIKSDLSPLIYFSIS